MHDNRRPLLGLALAGIVAALAFGATARLIWPSDMEYKGDEIFSFQKSQSMGVSEPWSWTGMNNSADVPHPGMSVWVFVGLARLIGATNPIELNIACMALNVIALVALVAFILWVIPADERETWWWGAALVAVNPLCVLFHRKIWPPSVLPAVTVLLLTGWWFRHRKGWAFFWGLMSALAAQIHPGAFFFSAGMAFWCFLFDRRSLRWSWAIIGGIIGSVPAIPWIYHLLTAAERSATDKSRWTRLFEFKYWNYWFSEPFGFSLQYSLGRDFADFLRWPLIGNHPTYLVAALHVLLFALMLLVFGRWLYLWWQRGTFSISRQPTDFTLSAVAFGYGLLLTVSGLPVYRHYMIITFPLMFVGLATMVLRSWNRLHSRRLLTTIVISQAALTMFFLCYVHQIDRPIAGDYGMPYRVQLESSQLSAGKY